MTGVGICFPILLAVTAFASLIGAGGAPRASIELGRGNFKKAERILGTSAAFLVAIALTLTVILQATKEPVLRAFGASDANIGYAVDFITIYLVGTVFVQLTLGLNNFISAQGKTTIAMTSVLIGTGTSIILDPVFIFVLGWGVKGAAVANVIAQLISSVWIILFLASGRSAIRLRPSNIRFNRVIVPILTLGLAPFIMQITECLINVVFNVGLQRYGGDDYVTSMTIITSLMQVVSVLTNGFQQGIQPIIGFNFGARRMDRVRQAIRVAFIAQITSATVLVSLLAAFPSVFAAWFTSSPEVIGIVTRMMPVFVAGWGVFGVELFVLTDGSILFNEVSPRPHDTGMVTLISQRLSEFALHARAILGLPVTEGHVALAMGDGQTAASHAIVVAGDGEAEFTGVENALAEPGTDLRIFAKPRVHGHRRMAVSLAIGTDAGDARRKAADVADALTITVR